MVPGLHPGPRERRVVDQAGVGEPAQHGLGGIIGHAAAPQRLRELSPGLGLSREQPQADLPSPGLMITGTGFRATRLSLNLGFGLNLGLGR
jgi:hypothetical protein